MDLNKYVKKTHRKEIHMTLITGLAISKSCHNNNVKQKYKKSFLNCSSPVQPSNRSSNIIPRRI